MCMRGLHAWQARTLDGEGDSGPEVRSTGLPSTTAALTCPDEAAADCGLTKTAMSNKLV